MKLKTLNRSLIQAGFIAAALCSGSAHAGAMASSMVNMTNFTVQKLVSDGMGGFVQSQVASADLQNLTFVSTMDYSASLTGYGSVQNSLPNSSNTGPGLDKPAACIGSGCNAALTTDNNFGLKPGLPIVGNYAAVDQREFGTPVAGLANYTQNNAEVANSAYASLETGTGSASTSSNNNLNAAWNFTAGFNGFISFDFLLDVYFQVALSAGEISPTFATASYDINFTLTCLDSVNTSCGFGTQNFPYSPKPFPDTVIVPPFGAPIVVPAPKTISLNAPQGNNQEIKYDTGVPLAFNSGWIPVIAGKSLQLSARINTQADLERVGVPEPTVLALLGIGLLGIGATLRKRAV